jgi:N-methylhydantoinase B
MKIEKVLLQVLANHCAAAAEAMGFTMMRTAHSTFVKETEDFSCQLMTTEGLTFASPRSTGATWYTGLDYGPVIRMFDDYREGDIYITNDPYSGYVATHSPDIHMWMPVFSHGELVCFIGSHIHNTDVGGAVPASLSRTLVEVHQEGIRVPPMRLMRDGKLNEDILRILRINVRAPDQNWGDMNAQLASMTIGERKVHEIIERFGHEEFKSGIGQLIEYAEQQSRDIIRQIPDGKYAFADYADEDSTGGYPARIKVTVEIAGDELILDFTGTDPQLVSSLNMPTGGNPRHALITVGLIYVLFTLDPTITLNAGTALPARAILPEGTVVNAQHPAAVGMRSLLCNVTQNAIIGAFTQAVPDRLPASPASGLSLLNVKTTGRGGRTVMASIGPVGGGAGGGPDEDGAEGSGANMAFLKNTPVEINEAEVPIRIRKYGLVADSGGAGRHRGGLGTVMEFQLFAPQSMVTARNRDRTVMTAWGLLGGHAGAASRFTKNPDSAARVDLGNHDIVMCDPGDVILLEGPGAGGYGKPIDRPLALVEEDVRCGFVSRDRARTDYGVVISDDGTTDEVSTAKLRRQMASPKPVTHYSHGAGRLKFEGAWTTERYAVLTRILAAAPVGWRYFVKHRLFAAIGEDAAPVDGGAYDVVAHYSALTKEFPELPSSLPFEDKQQAEPVAAGLA